MSEPIKVGDLVVVVRTHCCQDEIGTIYRVKEIKSYSNGWCSVCRARTGPLNLFIQDGDIGFERSEIKRIPPLSELEGQRTEEALKVDA